MNKLKRDDEVVVIAGKDKGKRGKVLKILAEGRVLVSGINMIKRATKPNPMLGTAGGLVEREAAMSVSNVAIFNPSSQKADRVGFLIKDDGSKVRIFKSDKEQIDK